MYRHTKWLIFICLFTRITAGYAAGLPLDTGDFSDINNLLSGDISKELVKTIGILADQRPYEPATALGTLIGLDMGIEATLVVVPKSFEEALKKAGLKVGKVPPAFPVPRIQVHKGIGNRVDIGASYVGYKKYQVFGGDLKIALINPDSKAEGVAWAVRLNFSRALMNIVETYTWTPQILISKKLDFTEPYMGVGYQYTKGKVTIPIDSSAALPAGVEIPPELLASNGPIELSGESKSAAFMAFLGLGIVFGPSAIHLTMEGCYNSAGYHTVGTKIGFRF